MARSGRLLCLCAAILVTTAAVRSAPSAEERDGALMSTLAVQTAMQQGRECLMQHRAKAAVEVLEGQISRINGNQTYLMLLRDAYRAYIRELRVGGQDTTAQTYLRRLQILEPGAVVDDTPVAAAPPAPAAPAPAMPATRGVLAFGPTTSPKIVARGKQAEDDDPFQPSSSAAPLRTDALTLAQQAFQKNDYSQAGALFAQAQTGLNSLPAEHREQWAYCKLHQVVSQLNRSPAPASFQELETEVRQAMELAPRLAYARDLLGEIDKRKRTDPPAELGHDGLKAPLVAVRHVEQVVNGWAVAETTNFKVYHHQAHQLAEQAARIAENTRYRMMQKWFGGVGENWCVKCEIFLHVNAQEYSRNTGQAPQSPGHSSFDSPSGPKLYRKIDLRCDDPNLLTAVLPHETTHTVLVGNFGDRFVPRWADEGMAVLTEPREKVERHLRNLPQHRSKGELFSLHQLVHMENYPDPRYVGAFYAESVSLVDFLVREKGAQTFAQFLRDGMRGNYESALAQYYGYRSFTELEQRWVRSAFPENVATGVAAAQR